MKKHYFETKDITSLNVEKIGAIFPNCITEVRNEDGTIKRGINFKLLHQALSSDVVDSNECYEFTWVGKKAAMLEANKPIRKTLRPYLVESKNWDSTENLYIEGDNLDVLKLLQEAYLCKVKLIYIDPPYNTGNDFIYADNFIRSQKEENEQMGLFDNDNNRLFKNTDNNGRFHSDWCSMMYSRLSLARNLLSEDGVIAISIDSNENHNLRKICEEIFGANNFISEIIIQNNPRGRQSDRFIATSHEYLLCFAKNIESCKINGIPLSEEQKEDYCYYDENGSYRLLGLRQRGVASLREDRPDMFFPIYVDPDTMQTSLEPHSGWKEVLPKKSDGRDGRWMWGKEKCKMDNSRLVARLIQRRGEYDIFVKDYLERDGNARTRKFKSIWDDKSLNNQVGTQEVKSLFSDDVMSFPKSREFIQLICRMGSDPESIVMDFFSGSATTAHAVMQLNSEDMGKRKFIMVQLPEPCDEKSTAFKNGYKNICEIGKERIRRAGSKIQNDNPLHTFNLDTGFRVFKLDDSNMKDVYYAASDVEQHDLFDSISNIKDDRSDLDLLFGCLLDWGVPLSLPYTAEKIEGFTVHTYNGGDLIACFDNDVSETVVREIAKRKPLRAVFRDSCFSSSPAKINVFEIFKLYMPEDADNISKRIRVI